MKKKEESLVKMFLEIHLPVGICNLRCSYCYVGNYGQVISKSKYTPDEIRRAFSKSRLGGACLISICSDGETLLHPEIISIAKNLLEEDHYVMIVTNGLASSVIKEFISMSSVLQRRLFFKISFHFEEMERMGLLDRFWDNIDAIKQSYSSFTIEYTTDNIDISSIKRMKEICRDRLKGSLPHINIPRDERKANMSLYSNKSWNNYCRMWEDACFESDFFRYRKQFFGKKYNSFCYNGNRYLWINLLDGTSHQCYGTRTIQNFMNSQKRIRRIARGNNCPYAHCYVCYTFFTLGTVDPLCGDFNPTYFDIRNRCGDDGINWVKEAFREVFIQGVPQHEFGYIRKLMTNIYNVLCEWLCRDKMYD